MNKKTLATTIVAMTTLVTTMAPAHARGSFGGHMSFSPRQSFSSFAPSHFASVQPSNFAHTFNASPSNFSAGQAGAGTHQWRQGTQSGGTNATNPNAANSTSNAANQTNGNNSGFHRHHHHGWDNGQNGSDGSSGDDGSGSSAADIVGNALDAVGQLQSMLPPPGPAPDVATAATPSPGQSVIIEDVSGGQHQGLLQLTTDSTGQQVWVAIPLEADQPVVRQVNEVAPGMQR